MLAPAARIRQRNLIRDFAAGELPETCPFADDTPKARVGRRPRAMGDGVMNHRRDIRRDDIAPLLEEVEDRAPDGDMPPDAVVSNDGLDPQILAEAAAGAGDDDDDVPEHLWPSEGVDTLGEYSRRAAESPEAAIDRMPDSDEDSPDGNA